jgi:hypothetical protein
LRPIVGSDEEAKSRPERARGKRKATATKPPVPPDSPAAAAVPPEAPLPQPKENPEAPAEPLG